MLKEIPFDKVPSFSIVEEQIRAACPGIIVEKVGRDGDLDAYVLRLHREKGKHADLKLSFGLLDDLKGRNPEHRRAQLKASIQDVINRLR